MIETTLLSYLKQELETNHVYMEMPSPIPKEFVTLEIKDRKKTDHIEAITIELMSYADSMYKAALLDEKVRDSMDCAATLDEVMSSKCGGGNNSTDTTNKKYRYRSYYNLYL